MFSSCAADTAGVGRSGGKGSGEDNPCVGTTFRTKPATSKQGKKKTQKTTNQHNNQPPVTLLKCYNKWSENNMPIYISLFLFAVWLNVRRLPKFQHQHLCSPASTRFKRKEKKEKSSLYFVNYLCHVQLTYRGVDVCNRVLSWAAAWDAFSKLETWFWAQNCRKLQC